MSENPEVQRYRRIRHIIAEFEESAPLMAEEIDRLRGEIGRMTKAMKRSLTPAERGDR